MMNGMHETAAEISRRAPHLAAMAIGRQLVSAPERTRTEEAARGQRLEELTLLLRCLGDALRGRSEQLFVDYVDWARTVHAARNVPDEELRDELASVRTVLSEELPSAKRVIDGYVNAALTQLAAPPIAQRSAIEPGSLAARYVERLVAYDRHGAVEQILRALDTGTSVRDLYLEVIQPAQHEIGRLWQLNRMSVAQEHYCTAVSQLVLAQLYPRIMRAAGDGPRMVATCVSGELHELGARMVADFFEMDGWDTAYVGANTPPGAVLEALTERRARLLAVSATMTFHIRATVELIRSVRAMPSLADVRILVGGRPFWLASQLWHELGADGCARNAEEAVSVGRALIGQPDARDDGGGIEA